MGETASHAAVPTKSSCETTRVPGRIAWPSLGLHEGIAGKNGLSDILVGERSQIGMTLFEGSFRPQASSVDLLDQFIA